MTVDKLIDVLEHEVKLSSMQIKFNEKKSGADPYERGYRDALKMVIKNLRDIPESREQLIPVKWIEDWSSSLWMGMSDLVCQKLIEHWRKENKWERTESTTQSDT